MEKQGAKTVVPKLRFPEFRASAEWEVHELQSIAHLAKGVQLSSSLKDDAAKFPHFNGGVTYSSRTGRANRDANTTIISEGGNSCGYVQFVDEPFWCGGHCYSIVPKRPDQNRYLFYVLQARQKEIMGLRVGSGLPNIPKNVLEKFEVAFAKDSFEQQKIADCLTSLDEVIAAQGRKIEALKAHKRGLMQQLFPREGETRPRLRFPEFHDAPEWKRMKIGDIAEVKASGDLDSALFSHIRSKEFSYPVYSNSVENEGLYGYYSSHQYCKGSITVTARGTLGVAFYRDHEFMSIGRLLVINEFRNTLASFFAFCWNHLAKVPQEVTSIPQFTAIAARETALPFPCEKEQQRIADCLSSLDTQIIAETNQLAALKTHKQGLMQQLFPAPEQG